MIYFKFKPLLIKYIKINHKLLNTMAYMTTNYNNQYAFQQYLIKLIDLKQMYT